MGRNGSTRAISVLVAGALAMGLPGAHPAWGQAASAGAQAGTTAADEEAARLFTEGMEAAQAQDWQKARDRLNRAYEIRKHWKIAANLGRVEVQLGWNREAAEHLDYFLRNAGPNDITQEDRQAAERMMNDARSKIATVTVIVDVGGAEVLVDGKVVGTSPLPGRLFLNPGARELQARKTGYETTRETLQLSAGSTQQVVFEMKAGKGGGGASGSQKTTPGGNGESLAGSDGRGVGGPVYPDPTIKTPAWRTWGIGVGVGLGLVGLGAGVGFTIVANGKNQQAKKIVDVLRSHTDTSTKICDEALKAQSTAWAQDCSDIDNLTKARDTFRTVGIVGFVVGGVAAAAAVTIALLPAGSKKTQKSVRVIPIASPTLAGAVYVGTF